MRPRAPSRGARRARRRLAALLPLLLPLACGVAERDELAGGADLGELVAAAVAEVELPARVDPDEGAILVVRGVSPDGCTRFDRFETQLDGSRLDVHALASRPLGPCESPVGEPFEARQTLAGLPPGLYDVVVNDTITRALAVARQADTPALCADATPLAVTRVVPPPATWPGGSAVVHVEGTLPSWCHVLAAPEVVRGTGRVSISLAGASCGLAQDAAACPEGAQPVALDVDAGPLAEGSYEVDVDGSAYGRVEVVAASQCRLRPLDVGAVDAPGPAAADTPPLVRFKGTLPSTCAALDPAVVTAADGVLSVSAPVHECAASCLPASRPVARATPVPDLAPGTWAVEVNGVSGPPLDVLPAGACADAPLPPEALGGLLVTSQGQGTILAGAPVDVTIYGTLPSACWRGGELHAALGDHVLTLAPSALRCEAACAAGGPPFLLGLGLPEGLAAGHWSVRIGDREEAGFDVR